ncbi:MAG: protein phosphatase, partial [Acidobacteriota bacterium]|nr:protein phosphatase [Acidobacteriota bacterium]
MKTSETDPIRLDFVVSKDYPSLNRLGMTLAPGKKVQNAAGKDWDRDLESDLSRLKHHYEVDSLVSLVAFEELERLRIEDLPRRCRSKSIELIQFPIKDGFTPPA